mgnify:CR=1 FL=1
MVKKQDLHPQVKLMIASSADRKGPSFGKGAATLLHGIEQNGSLNKTAKDLHMAYSKAWSMIKKVEEGLGFTLIERYGARGSKLTEEGKKFLELTATMRRSRRTQRRPSKRSSKSSSCCGFWRIASTRRGGDSRGSSAPLCVCALKGGNVGKTQDPRAAVPGGLAFAG